MIMPFAIGCSDKVLGTGQGLCTVSGHRHVPTISQVQRILSLMLSHLTTRPFPVVDVISEISNIIGSGTVDMDGNLLAYGPDEFCKNYNNIVLSFHRQSKNGWEEYEYDGDFEKLTAFLRWDDVSKLSRG
jgi:hypothetical protein